MPIEIIKEEENKEEEVIELYKNEIPTQTFNDIIKQENPVRLSDITRNLGNVFVKSANGITVEYGSDILLKHGGDIKFTSVTKPTACTATLVATSTGNVDAGTHIYKVTYVNATGETELGTASLTVTTDATHKQVDLSTIPKSTSGSVIKRKIYRTKAGGTNYYLLTTINDNTTTTYTDNTADASLTGRVANYKENDTFGKIIIDGIEALSLGARNTFVGQNTGVANITGLYNSAVGSDALLSNTTGSSNTAMGDGALYKNTSGDYNSAMGRVTLFSNETGNDNSAVGDSALTSNTTGNNNTAIGDSTLLFNETGSNNTAIGYYSLRSNETGTGNVGLGYSAGYYETGSDKLFIDNVTRANEADGRAKALIYGVFAAATANQRLTINAILKNSVQAGITAFATGGQASAVAITANIVEISVCATAQDSVKLPSAETGMKIIITNHGAASCDVFPNTSDAINEATVDTAKALAVDASMMCVAYDVTNWECLTLAR